MTPRYKLMVTASYGGRPPHAPILSSAHVGRPTLTWPDAVTEFQRSNRDSALYGGNEPVYDNDHGDGGLVYMVVPA